jgi:hypothetical protein
MPETIQFGLNIAAAQARNVMFVSREQMAAEYPAEMGKLQSAYALMMPPLCQRNAAQAYDVVLKVMEMIPSKPSFKLRQASRLVRDALILAVCCTEEMSRIGFEFALEYAFQRTISRELRSQLFLAHASVMRLGSQEQFLSLTLEERRALWNVYRTCQTLHRASDGWEIPEEKKAKKKSRKAKPSVPHESDASSTNAGQPMYV